ncbi:MAG: MFS transporter, partial [Pseudomonadota bacterium]
VLSALGSRWLPETHVEPAPAGGAASDLLRIRPLRNALLASSIVASAWDLYQFFMPIYGHAQGLSATAIGTVMSAFAISIILVRALMPFALRRAGAAQLLTYAMFVACAAYGLFPLFHTAWPLAAVSFVLGIGCGCSQPLSLTLVYDASPKGRAGETAGLRIMANQIVHFIVPLVFGALGSVAGMSAVFITNAACLAVGGYISQRSYAKR